MLQDKVDFTELNDINVSSGAQYYSFNMHSFWHNYPEFVKLFYFKIFSYSILL